MSGKSNRFAKYIRECKWHKAAGCLKGNMVPTDAACMIHLAGPVCAGWTRDSYKTLFNAIMGKVREPLLFVEPMSGDTALHRAVAHANYPMIELLLFQNCFLYYRRNYNNKAPVDLSESVGDQRFVDKTLCLSYARLGEIEEVMSMIPARVDSDVVDLVGRGLLHSAAMCRGNLQRSNIRKLFSLRLKVDLPDNQGNTPLHIASERGNFPMIEALFFRDPNIDGYANEVGIKPIELCPDNNVRNFFYKSQCLSYARHGLVSDMERNIREKGVPS